MGSAIMAKHAVKQDKTARDFVLIDLALQGGGSHGAFTWGVLDRLLEEPWLKIEAISGTSAGAMNAAVLVSGHMQGGAEGARAALDAYWRRVAERRKFSPLQRSPLDRLMNRWTLDTSPAYLAMDLMTPGPFALRLSIRWASIRSVRSWPRASISRISPRRSIKLFITATNVHTGRGRVFRNPEITPEVLLASACLPTMFQAIEIDGEPYWDGGFAGNPTITPLVRESDAHDTILVQINPRERRDTPRTASAILDRLNEISFNSPLMKELRMIALLRQAADPGSGEGARWAKMRTHRIMTDKLAEFGASSKLNAEWAFLAMLKEEGRRSADEFLAAHREDVGNEFDDRSGRPAGGVLSVEPLRPHRPRRNSDRARPPDLARLQGLERPLARAARRHRGGACFRGSLCSPTGPRRSCAARPASSPSSFRSSCSARCSAS